MSNQTICGYYQGLLFSLWEGKFFFFLNFLFVSSVSEVKTQMIKIFIVWHFHLGSKQTEKKKEKEKEKKGSMPQLPPH